MNHLEQLIAEWFEFRGYFVRRNVKVGKLPHGGHEGELDIVAYHPIDNHLIQIEPSSDAHTWVKRNESASIFRGIKENRGGFYNPFRA